MNNQKGISSIIIVLILVVIVGGGILAWQYLGAPKEEVKSPEEAPKEEVKSPEEEMTTDETADWHTYQVKPFQDLQPHKPWGFEFKYPKEFVLNPGDHPDFPTGSFLKAHRSGAGVWSANVAVSVTLPQSAYSGTNFQSAWLTVAYDPDIANLPNCQELERNEIVEKMSESQIISGVTWYKGIIGGAALGTTVESKVYHTLRNDMCYEVALHLSTANIANFDPALGIKAVDKTEVWAKLESIFSTFKFIE